MSVKSQNEQEQNLFKNTLSNSQQELLEMMYDFKTGERTISEVEQQFQEWLAIHTGTLEQREWQRSPLKNEYEKAKRPTAFGLPDIRNFILRKPKKKNVKRTASDDRRYLEKQIPNVCEGESRRMSKISCTSASSGISDNSDVFQSNCYFNPGYAFFGEVKASGSSTPSKFSSSSHEECRRPLPPPPLPAAALKYFNLTAPDVCSAKNNAYRTESNASTADENSPSSNSKAAPIPPPKPKNIPEILNCLETGLIENENGKENEEKEDEPRTPDSPDYITPNPVRFFPAQYRKISNCSKANDNLQNNSHKKPSSEFTKPEALSNSTKNCANDPAKTLLIKRQIFKLANQWIKLKKKEQAMFYVASRRWNSFPELDVPQTQPQPTYIELIASPEEISKAKNEANEKTD